ncbi:GNVR domain-containing protein, partial [Proteus mirabilis]|uniref:GNVR domain-containing protein n=1 Tax=Proteus mirabilis TaxID=584 RepID=UPI0023B77BA7
SEAAIRTNLDRVKTETATSDRANVGLRELERTLESRRGVYEAFLKRSREASEQERLNSTNVRVISQATPARLRSWPPSPKVVLPVALVLGLMAGAALAYRRASRREGLPAAARTGALIPVPARAFRAADA